MEYDFDAVRAFIVRQPDLRHGSGATPAELDELLAAWSALPPDFENYLREFGWLTWDACELFGLGRDVPTHQNLLDRARALWRGEGGYKLPSDLLPFYDSGGGWFYCLSRLHPGQPVVCWAHEYEEQDEQQPYDETYPSWSSWFLEHLTGTAE